MHVLQNLANILQQAQFLVNEYLHCFGVPELDHRLQILECLVQAVVVSGFLECPDVVQNVFGLLQTGASLLTRGCSLLLQKLFASGFELLVDLPASYLLPECLSFGANHKIV